MSGVASDNICLAHGSQRAGSKLNTMYSCQDQGMEITSHAGPLGHYPYIIPFFVTVGLVCGNTELLLFSVSFN